LRNLKKKKKKKKKKKRRKKEKQQSERKNTVDIDYTPLVFCSVHAFQP
jgi:hypothetical protein